MPGWHNPLDDRLYREILDQDAEIKRLRAALSGTGSDESAKEAK